MCEARYHLEIKQLLRYTSHYVCTCTTLWKDNMDFQIEIELNYKGNHTSTDYLPDNLYINNK